MTSKTQCSVIPGRGSAMVRTNERNNGQTKSTSGTENVGKFGGSARTLHSGNVIQRVAHWHPTPSNNSKKREFPRPVHPQLLQICLYQRWRRNLNDTSEISGSSIPRFSTIDSDRSRVTQASRPVRLAPSPNSSLFNPTPAQLTTDHHQTATSEAVLRNGYGSHTTCPTSCVFLAPNRMNQIQ